MDIEKLKALVAGTKAKMEARSGKGDKAEKPPAGKSKWRILPGWADSNVFFAEIGEHWIKDDKGKVLGVLVCERDTYEKPCEICDAVWTAIKATKDDDQIKALKEMLSKRAFLFNALRLDGAAPSLTDPKLLALPPTAAEMFISLVQSRAVDDGVNMLDPNEGYDITIEKTGTGFDTKYSITNSLKPSVVAPEALKNLKDISGYIEKQRADGARKDPAIVRQAITLIMSDGGDGGRLVIPGKATEALAISAPRPARVIEVEATDPSFEIEAALPLTEAEIETVAPKKVVAAAPAKKVEADDIDALLAELGSN